MTILGSLGAVTPASQTGDAADVTLTPDAETLALFASLFAMIQPQTRAPEAGMPADPAMQEGDPAAIPPANPEMSQALPAAAMLISGAGKTEGRPLDDQALSDMAPLSHLLTVAKTMTGAETVPQIDDRTPVDADLGEQGPDVTTAKAILVRAIEILDDIDSGQPAAQDIDIEVAPAAAPTGSQPEPKPAAPIPATSVQIVVEAAPSPDFVGPMPATPVRMVVEAAPSPDFVGPMPATPVRMVVEAAPSPDFVGPMPATPVRMVVEAAPSPDFVGPMPATPVRMVVEAAPSPDFVGPMPATPVRMVVEAALSPDFVGPMPATPVRMVVEAAPSPDFVGPMPATPVQMVAEVPKPTDLLRTTPVIAADGAPRSPVPQGLTPPQSTLMSGEASRPSVPAEALAGVVGQDDAATEAQPRQDRQASLKGQSDEASQRMVVKPETGYGKVPKMPSSNGPETTQAPVVSAREIRAAMDQPATSNGQSSSATSTAVSGAAGAGGQSGNQGQSGHQSGQGGGQSASHYAADPTPSRDVADRAILHRLNTANAGWSETMIKRLTSDLRAGVQSVRIILEPRNLGRLNVDLGLRDGKASIRIAAETAEAANLLAGARGQLSQMLEQSGMRLAGFQSSAGGQEAQGDTAGGQQGHAQQDSGGKNTGRNGNFSNTLNEAEGRLHQDDSTEEEHDLALRQGETAVLSVLA